MHGAVKEDTWDSSIGAANGDGHCGMFDYSVVVPDGSYSEKRQRQRAPGADTGRQERLLPQAPVLQAVKVTEKWRLFCESFEDRLLPGAPAASINRGGSMADQEQLECLRRGSKGWNTWRQEHPDEHIDLSGADLQWADLSWADLRKADLSDGDLWHANISQASLSSANLTRAMLEGANCAGANFSGANLTEARLSQAALSGADLTNAVLSGADLTNADLRRAVLFQATLVDAKLSLAMCYKAFFGWANLTKANLSEGFFINADFREADLTSADLRRADLTFSNLVQARLDNADLTGCKVYGVAAWDVQLAGAKQAGLVISHGNIAQITVDDLEVAQFIHLLLTNKKIRKVIQSVTSKAVLILGRFTERQKPVLDSLHTALRDRHKLVPILFDWEPSENRDLTETVLLLANMCRFVIADVTDAKSIPQELSHIVPNLPTVPVQPIILASEQEYAMFEHWRKFPAVLPEYRYESREQLLDTLDTRVLAPIEHWEESTDKAAAKERQMREENEAQRSEISKLKQQLAQNQGLK